MSAISFTIPGLIKKVLDKLPLSTSDLARANVCTEQRLSVLDDISAHTGASGSYLRHVTLTGSGTWSKPADMLGSTVWVTGCGAGGRGGVWAKNTSVAGASAGACAILVPVTVGASVSYSVANPQLLTAADGAQAASTVFGSLTLPGGRAAMRGTVSRVNPGGGNDADELAGHFLNGLRLEHLQQHPAAGVVWTGGHGGFVHASSSATPIIPFQNAYITASGRVTANLSADSLLGVSRQGGTRWGSGGVARHNHAQENDAAAASGPGLLRVYYPAAG